MPSVRRDDRAANGEPEAQAFAFVVKNGSKSRSATFGASPLPLSTTVTVTKPLLADVDTASARSAGSVASIASQALINRFSRTCCSCTRSPRLSGMSAPRREANSTWCATSCPRASPSASPTRWLTSSGWKSALPFFNSSRRRPMTSPARLSSVTISLSISRISSRSISFRASNSSAACALLRIAVSGWLSSCASAPESSPRIATRVKCVTCSRRS